MRSAEPTQTFQSAAFAALRSPECPITEGGGVRVVPRHFPASAPNTAQHGGKAQQNRKAGGPAGHRPFVRVPALGPGEFLLATDPGQCPAPGRPHPTTTAALFPCRLVWGVFATGARGAQSAGDRRPDSRGVCARADQRGPFSGHSTAIWSDRASDHRGALTEWSAAGFCDRGDRAERLCRSTPTGRCGLQPPVGETPPARAEHCMAPVVGRGKQSFSP